MMLAGVMLQAAAREARANQIKLDAQQLETLLFQLFERKVGQQKSCLLWPPSCPLPLCLLCHFCLTLRYCLPCELVLLINNSNCTLMSQFCATL